MRQFTLWTSVLCGRCSRKRCLPRQRLNRSFNLLSFLILPKTAETSGSLKWRMAVSVKSRGMTFDESQKRTKSEMELLIPRFLEYPLPRFVELFNTRQFQLFAIAQLWSVDPSSTTMISSNGTVCLWRATMHSSKVSSELYVGTTPEILKFKRID